MKTSHTDAYVSRIPFQHIVLRPMRNVLHIHFRDRRDAVAALNGIFHLASHMGYGDHGEPSQAGCWRGMCWGNGRQIVDEVWPSERHAPTTAAAALRREMAKMEGDFALVATIGWWGCEHYLVRHEVAHAIWHLNAAYRGRATKVLAALSRPLKEAILRELNSRGYVNPRVPFERQRDDLMNEMQAQIYCGHHFGAFDDEEGRANGERELAYVRHQLYEAMEECCPLLNDAGMVRVAKWRDLRDSRQEAHYPVWLGTEPTACESLEEYPYPVAC